MFLHRAFFFMIKGKIKPEFSTTDEIYNLTNGGYDIFRYYLSKISRIMSRPWGKKEKHPSWGIYRYSNGFWYYKDHATEESGTAIQFVQKYFNLSFKQAMDKVKFDFGLPGGIEINKSPVKITWEKPDIENEFVDIGVITKPFEKKHHEFWNSAEVSEEHCKKYNCYAIKSLSINKKFFNIKKNEIVFGYYSPEEYGWKIYFPEREKEKRFRNNVSGGYLWNYQNLKQCEDLIIQKSVKDLIVTTLITPCVVATQNESVGIFNEEMVKKINTITRSPWIWYGSDWDGVKKCKQITDTNKWKYINTPKNLLPEINDAYGYVKKFGIKSLEDFMKSKKLLK